MKTVFQNLDTYLEFKRILNFSEWFKQKSLNETDKDNFKIA